MKRRSFLAAMFGSVTAIFATRSSVAEPTTVLPDLKDLVRGGPLVALFNVPGGDGRQVALWSNGVWEIGYWDGIQELSNYPKQMRELADLRRRLRHE